MLLVLGLGFLLYSVAALYIFQYGQVDRAAPADAIVILGGGVRRNGTPSPAQHRRTQHGALLYEQGLAPYIICTGTYDSPRHIKSEAAVCVDLLLEYGVPADAILFEDKSASTEENAIETHKIMREKNLKTAILVSDNFHMLRAELLFRARGIPVSLSPAQITSGPLSLNWMVYGSLREVAGLIWQVTKDTLQLPYTRSPF
jgi:uncharacterized SAM-binding protein YcdF (DUF218 family)